MKKNEIMVVVIAISSFIVGLSFSYEFFRIPAIIAAWIGGAAAAYIFLSAEESVNDEKEKVMQGILVEKSNLSKATVSRILDSLEGKGLIVRQRHGMNNVILLK